MNPRQEAKLDHVIRLLGLVLYKENAIMATAQDLLDDVNDQTTVDQSIITLLGNIKAQLDAAGTDAAKLDQVKAVLDSNKAAIAAAVQANTPAAPPPAA